MFKYSKHNTKCKLEIANVVSENKAPKEEKDASDLSFAHNRIGIYERLANEIPPGAHIPNGHIWGNIHDQVQRKSLEWKPWNKYMDINEFNKVKNQNIEYTSINPPRRHYKSQKYV